MIEVKEERLSELENKEEAYEKAFKLLRDLLPSKEETKETAQWDQEQLEGLFEEVDYILESCINEIR